MLPGNPVNLLEVQAVAGIPDRRFSPGNAGNSFPKLFGYISIISHPLPQPTQSSRSAKSSEYLSIRRPPWRK